MVTDAVVNDEADDDEDVAVGEVSMMLDLVLGFAVGDVFGVFT